MMLLIYFASYLYPKIDEEKRVKLSVALVLYMGKHVFILDECMFTAEIRGVLFAPYI